MSKLVFEYAVQYGDVHVTMGPVYDYDYDGLADMELSNRTRYYKISIVSD